MHRFVFYVFLLVALLIPVSADIAAAEKPSKVPAEDPAKTDAKQAFARQAATAVAPTGIAPAFMGSYLWSGRADQSYRPFFQWEFRIQAGRTPLNNIRTRMATLGPMKIVQTQGEWHDVATLAAGATTDFDYRLNCANFAAYQIELAWSGGSETYIACDKYSLPIAIGELANLGLAVAVNPNFEANEKTGLITVAYSAWNIGGKPARQAVMTIHFKDAAGKDVETYKHKPEKEDLPAGYVKEFKVLVARVPAFTTVTISTEQAEAPSEGPGFTGAKDIEVAKLRSEGTQLKARVRNGLDSDQRGIVVQITLQDKAGKTVKALEIPVGVLAKGEERDVSADLGGVTSWAAYEVGWKGDNGERTETVHVSIDKHKTTGLPQVIIANGLTFTPKKIDRSDDALVVRGTMSNTTGRELTQLHVAVEVTDSTGKSQHLAWQAPSLANGASTEAVVACGVTDISAMTMTWKTGPADND